MKDTGWYRKQKWTQQNKEDFYNRLSRCRYLAPIYASAQVDILAASGKPKLIQEAIELLLWVLKKWPDSVYTNSLYLSLAMCYEHLNNIPKTIEYYQACLTFEEQNPNKKTNAAENFALFVGKNKLRNYYDAMDTLLKKRQRDFIFPISLFKITAAFALMNSDLGKKQVAKTFAKMAFEEAAKTSSGSAKHPELGLVGEIENTTINLLNNIIRG